MRGLALGAALGATALLAVMPANASAREVYGEITARGGLTITWHGDPARGCGPAGLCGYRGSLTVPGLEYGEYFLDIVGRRVGAFDGYFDLTGEPLVRVRRTEAGTDGGSCADFAATTQELGLTAKNAGPGRARIGLAAVGFSPGRCGGPNLDKAVARLPRGILSLSRLRSRGATVDLSGSAPYSAGRFSGTVTSTLKIRLQRPLRERGRARAPRPPRRTGPRKRPTKRVRTVHVHAVYRITGFTGKLTESFGGLSDPPCEGVDACGVRGKTSWTIQASGGALSIDARAVARPSDRGVRGALVAVTRHYGAFAEIRQPLFFGTTSADVTRPDGLACHDTVRAASPGIDATIGRRGITLEVGYDDLGRIDTNLVRTGCPGPRDFDALAPFDFSPKAVPVTQLARRNLQLTTSARGSFAVAPYEGSGSGRFTVTLRRRSLRVAYGHRRVPR